MKTPKAKMPVLTLRDALNWLVGECRNFDTATRLCADYCITAQGLDALTGEILKREKSKSHRPFIMRPGKGAGKSLLAAR